MEKIMDDLDLEKIDLHISETLERNSQKMKDSIIESLKSGKQDKKKKNRDDENTVDDKNIKAIKNNTDYEGR